MVSLDTVHKKMRPGNRVASLRGRPRSEADPNVERVEHISGKSISYSHGCLLLLPNKKRSGNRVTSIRGSSRPQADFNAEPNKRASTYHSVSSVPLPLIGPNERLFSMIEARDQEQIVNLSWSKTLDSRSRKFNYFFLVEISIKEKLLKFLGREPTQNSTKEN